MKKFEKKGLLTKLAETKSRKSSSLEQILKESTAPTPTSSSQPSNDEYLRKFNTTTQGGPKHSIAVTRAHHLTNFLSEYIINAFQSGHFESPDLSEPTEEVEKEGKRTAPARFLFEISKVELLSDLSALKIYWHTSAHEQVNVQVEKFLGKSLQGQIRSHLTEQRIISYVPRIVFVRDASRVLMAKLEEFIAKMNKEDEQRAGREQEQPSLSSSVKNSAKLSRKLIDNMYGVSFSRLMETIKKDASFNEWKVTKDVDEKKGEEKEASKVPPSSLATPDENNVINSSIAPSAEIAQKKFSAGLRALEINRRLKEKRVNKSSFMALGQIEMEMAREKNVLNLFEDENY
jgi:ribosome-binding factor A